MAWGVLLQGRGICSLRIQALLRLAILLGSSSVAKHSADFAGFFRCRSLICFAFNAAGDS